MTAGKLAQLATRGRSSRVVASEAKRELAWMNNEMGGVHLIKMRPLLQVLSYYISCVNINEHNSSILIICYHNQFTPIYLCLRQLIVQNQLQLNFHLEDRQQHQMN